MDNLPPELIKEFRGLTKDEKLEFIASLTPKQALALQYCDEAWLRDNQVIPEGDWRYCLILAGRGFGKSFALSCWVKKKALQNPGCRIGIIAPVYKDLVDFIVPAILDRFPPGRKPKWNKTTNQLTFNNGSTCYCMSSDSEIRGPNLHFAVIDELCKFNNGIPEHAERSFELMDMSVRIGINGSKPQIVIATTPKPWPLMKRLERDAKDGVASTVLMTGRTRDNADNLDSNFLAAMERRHAGTRLGQQELEGKIVDEAGALWSWSMIETNRLKRTGSESDVEVPPLTRIVVAIDPAVSTNRNSDETGIVVAGRSSDGHIYVLADKSGKYGPNEWAVLANALFFKFHASRIVAEKNNGGDLVEANLRQVNNALPIKLVHASKGKMARAEPIAALYEQNRVHHVGILEQLEEQLITYTGSPGESPDRLDALVWAIHELVFSPRVASVNVEDIPYYFG